MAEKDEVSQAEGGSAEGPGGVAEGFGEKAVSRSSGADYQDPGIYIQWVSRFKSTRDKRIRDVRAVKSAYPAILKLYIARCR